MGKQWKIRNSRDIDNAFRKPKDPELRGRCDVQQCKGSHKKGKIDGGTVMTYYDSRKDYPVGIRRKFEKKLTALGLIVFPFLLGALFYTWARIFEVLAGG